MKIVTFLKNYFVVFGLVTLFFATNWAVLRSDFFRVHDFTQAARIVEMANAVVDGHFPVIWSENLGYGYGMPLFEFYAPLPYYATAIFYLLGFSVINSVKLLFVIPAIFTIWGSYLLGKKLFGSLGGILVASSYVLFPYRAVNLFVRGSLSEIWGMMALPFILLGIIASIKKEKYAWVLLTLSIVVLLLSHNLTALLFLPLSIIFGAVYVFSQAYFTTKKTNIIKTVFCQVLHLISAYFLAVCISAFYVVPAFLEKGFTRLESSIVTEYFDFRIHFVFIKQFFIENWGYGGSAYGLFDGISFFLGFGQLLGLFFVIFLFIRKSLQVAKKPDLLFKKDSLFKKHSVVFLTVLGLTGLSLLLTTAKTQFIWESIPLLAFLQFPWRFLSAAGIFLALTLGYICVFAPNKLLRMLYLWILFILLVVGNFKYFQPERFYSVAESSEFYYSDTAKIRSDMSTTLPDYIPIQVTQEKIEPIAYADDMFVCNISDTCEFTQQVITNKVHKKEVKVTTKKEETLTFTISDFPGWEVRVNDSLVKHSQSDMGAITVTLPAGTHTLIAQLYPTPVRKYANILSLLGIVAFGGLCALLGVEYIKNKKQNQKKLQ